MVEKPEYITLKLRVLLAWLENLNREYLLMTAALLEAVIRDDFRRLGRPFPLEPIVHELRTKSEVHLKAWCEALIKILLLKHGETIDLHLIW